MRFIKSPTGDNPELAGWRDSHGVHAATPTPVSDLCTRFERYEQDLYGLESKLGDLKGKYSSAAIEATNKLNKKETDLHERYSESRKQHVIKAKEHAKNPPYWTRALANGANFVLSFYDEHTDSKEAKHKKEIEEQSILDAVYSAKEFVEEIEHNLQKHHISNDFMKDFEELKASDCEYIDVSISFEEDDWKELTDRIGAAIEAYKDTEELYRVFVEENSGENLMNRPEVLKMLVKGKMEKYHSALKEIKDDEKRKDRAFAHFMLKVLEHPGL